MARTTPVSNGWTIFVRPLGTIRPVAVVTMSTLPRAAQASATQNSAIMVPPTAPASGCGGVSTISRAAGRKASSSADRDGRFGGDGARASANIMDACLHAMERGVSPAGLDQLVMGSVLNQTAALNGDDPVAPTYRGQPVRNDENRAAT